MQAHSNPDRLRRRQMRRHGYDEAEAQRRIPDTAARQLDLPFVQLHSAGTEQAFRLFIQHDPLQPTPRHGTFSAYGLSPETTIPWF